jgi:Mn-dependent DtxR family transcriptional regulator
MKSRSGLIDSKEMEGRRIATRVMRKHRLAECLLADVIGLERR